MIRLTLDSLGPDPMTAFDAWFREAEAGSGQRYPNAVVLATVDAEGHPDARVVLLKGIDVRGFQFFTNYQSAKGSELASNPHASLVFYWDAMGRQVRVRGRTERLSESESDAYFQSRPRESRIGAWTSEQSRPVESREALEARFAEVEARFAGEEVPRPPHWGGFLLRPVEVEFWAEGDWRVHDRIRFSRPLESQGEWSRIRLQP
jgi:pyridoxamine 5'-phosphate oxidase